MMRGRASKATDSGEEDVEEPRLQRIEKKLDQLVDKLEHLARLDERMVTVFNRIEKLERGFDSLGLRIAAQEKIDTARGPFFVWLERAGIAFLGAVAAWLIKAQFGG